MDQRLIEAVEVGTEFRAVRRDGSTDTWSRRTRYTPDSISARGKDLLAEIRQRFGSPVCLLTKARCEPDESEEHIILQGLGTRWIALARGLVRTEVNNACHAREGRFVSRGRMGILLPFYVRRAKDIEFTGEGGDRVVFENVPDRGTEKGGFRIAIHRSSGTLILPDSPTGPGEISFSVPVKPIEPRDVSRVIHKIAYLAFCLEHGIFGLASEFDACRSFVVEDGAPYRPYSETFLRAAQPGFVIEFYVVGAEDEDGHLRIAHVAAALRLHHLRYDLSLVGGEVSAVKELAEEGHLEGLVLEADPPATRFTIGFGFEGTEPRTTVR